jgi:hypothetical protein
MFETMFINEEEERKTSRKKMHRSTGDSPAQTRADNLNV